jgi:hypothetical protein
MTYKHKNRRRPNEFVQTVNNMKTHKNKIYKKSLSLTFKKGTRQNYVIQKQKHKNYE